MSEVLREVHVVVHDAEGTSGWWWWYPTRAKAREAYEEEVGIWTGSAHVRLLRKNIPLFFDTDETTDWIQNSDAEGDFADWEVVERDGPMPSGMADPHPETSLQPEPGLLSGLLTKCRDEVAEYKKEGPTMSDYDQLAAAGRAEFAEEIINIIEGKAP